LSTSTIGRGLSSRILLQSQLLETDAAPQIDIAGHSPGAILDRAGLGPPSSEDLYQEQRAREVWRLA
jgi:hypothetical protein